ncbi:DUF4198 domain-containing protein [Calycomorphotria hydatis]|uniref:Nickel uptake substrate-specific transmembrane region n=1 Tax=Calycomorphotria hydatis TaxID=2528027 RepID=A0A517T650_9PLAN|nr:DUF4198 domain-containing protein [Calycomorphotria hydatis]QDT63840.1 hypothetical protein V22_10650 [Calycomorphotria hydatis]
MNFQQSLLLLATCCLFMTGCGGETYEFVPVQGQVTLNGKPLVNVNVYFNPLKTGEDIVVGPSSFGKTNADGNFELRIARKKGGVGAQPGKHSVSFSDATDDQDAPSKIPAKYEGGIQYEVPAEGTEAANFELTSK